MRERNTQRSGQQDTEENRKIIWNGTIQFSGSARSTPTKAYDIIPENLPFWQSKGHFLPFLTLLFNFDQVSVFFNYENASSVMVSVSFDPSSSEDEQWDASMMALIANGNRRMTATRSKWRQGYYTYSSLGSNIGYILTTYSTNELTMLPSIADSS